MPSIREMVAISLAKQAQEEKLKVKPYVNPNPKYTRVVKGVAIAD